MPHAYTEDQLVEQPAIQLFAELGWSTVSAMDETLGPTGTLGRETTGDVILDGRVRVALARLNPALLADALDAAVAELTRDRGAMTPVAANREIWALLRDGVPVQVPDREHGGERDERVRVIDWDTPAANDFLLVCQLTVTGRALHLPPRPRRIRQRLAAGRRRTQEAGRPRAPGVRRRT